MNWQTEQEQVAEYFAAEERRIAEERAYYDALFAAERAEERKRVAQWARECRQSY